MVYNLLYGIDISSWQGGKARPATIDVDFYIVKATEGLSYVDPYCDPVVQECISKGKLWGFYHFNGLDDAAEEADYFIANCENYFGEGIPVLDWEYIVLNDGTKIDVPVSWVNKFVRRVHEKIGIWPWIYGNPWRFNQGGVEPNCMRWVAQYPAVHHPTFAQAAKWDIPEADGLVGAWQFCSDGRLKGYSGNLDCNLFYGDENAWRAYAGYDASSGGDGGSGDSDSGASASHVSTLENDDYKVTIERK